LPLHLLLGAVVVAPGAAIGESDLISGLPSGSGNGVARADHHPLTTPQVARAYGKLPLSFEANRGQTDSRVKFLSRGAGYTLFLTPREAVLSLRQPVPGRGGAASGLGADARRKPGRERHIAVRMRLAGANLKPRVQGVHRLAGTTNYLVGRDPNAWRTAIPGFAGARYRNVYRGVDLVYHGTQGRLEYDFRVAPGADAGQVAIDFSGTRDVSLDRHGDLILRTAAGALRQHRPVIYQQVAGARRAVRGRFVVRGRRVEFRVGRYDRSRPLVIDPVLEYSTYLGGRGGDRGSAIAVDGTGNAYVAGLSASADFPISDGAYQSARTGDPADIFDSDAFVTKIGTSGKLVYSTFLGGGGASDFANAIAVDASGRAYVAGETQSQAFPTTAGALQPKAPPSYGTAFFTVLKADGSGLVYSSYLGGPDGGGDVATGVAVDGSGRAYVTGGTSSADFPTKAGAGSVDPIQSHSNGSSDAFVAKLNPDATGDSSLVYSTYLGGADYDGGGGIAVDSGGDAYVTGSTYSVDFPTQNPLPGQAASVGSGDAFVSKLNANGSALEYSTYLGGTNDDSANGIALDGPGHAYITGSTTSPDFPTKDAFQPQPGSPEPYLHDAFVAELSPDGSAFEYSSYLGGKGDDVAQGIGVDASGGAYVVGEADGQNTSGFGTFPSVDPLAKPADTGDAFVTRVRPGGGGLSFSSYFGGGGEDAAYAVAVDSSGSAYLTGDAVSTDLPTYRPLQAQSASRAIGDRRDAFVVKIAPGDPGAPVVTDLGHLSGPRGTSVIITGHGFAGATVVRFGGVAADRFTVDSDTQITATAPAPGEGPTPVTVTTTSGTSGPNPIADFTYAQGTWDLTDLSARLAGVATRLKDGRVLVAGGCCGPDFSLLATAELYDPSDGKWHATGSMNAPRYAFTATLLSDGRVLVAGGNGPDGTLNTAELYDPATGAWTTTGSMAQARYRHTATLLPTGKVLVTGGDGPLASAELYDPTTEKWTDASPMREGRSQHTATLLPTGMVLVAGGCCDTENNNLASAELYDPATDSWTSTGSLATGRAEHTATRLEDGRVLLAGGSSRFLYSLASAEVYDPAAGTFTSAGAMAHPRGEAAAALLSNGKVLVTGGFEGNNGVHNTAEVYDPVAGHWGSAGVMRDYRGAFGLQVLFAIPLTTGKVLVGGAPGTSDELYDPTPDGGPDSGPGANATAPASSGPVPGGAFPPLAGTDVTAPVLSGLGLSNNPFVVGHRSTSLFGVAAALRHRRGTAFRYRLSEAARVRIVISRRRTGRRQGGRCVTASFRLRHAQRCARLLRQGTLTRTSHRGANRVAFSGRIGAKALRPGRYQGTLTATDAAKNTSRPRTITFTIARR